MRWTTVLPCLALCLFCRFSGELLAVERANGAQISDGVVNRHGLTSAWVTQVSMDASSSRLQHVSLFVDRSRSYTVHEISYENRKEYVSERDIDSSGELLGVEGAKKKVAHRLLFLKGKNPVVTAHVFPQSFLVCVSSRGMVQVIDAETGRSRWSKLIGNPRFVTLAPAISEEQIGIISGNTLHLVRTEDGLPLKTIPLKHVAAAGGAIAEGWIYVPRMDGTMDWYPINEQTKLPSWFRGTGSLETQPSVHPGYVTWMTEDGYLYALNSFTQKVQFEIKLVGKPVASPLYAGDYKIIAATRAGYVVCVDLRTSTILWRYSTGEPMTQQPLVVGNSVYATNTTGLITKLNLATGVDIETGDVAWTGTGVSKLLAAGNGRIYGVSPLGDLVAIDPASGGIVDRIEMAKENALNFFNPISNRLLVANREGLIQSLRPTSQVFPVYFPGALEIAKNGDQSLIKKKPAATATTKDEAPSTAPAADSNDPFGAPGKEPTPPAEKTTPAEKAPNSDPFGG
jgi:hypothetical protein